MKYVKRRKKRLKRNPGLLLLGNPRTKVLKCKKCGKNIYPKSYKAGLKTGGYLCVRCMYKPKLNPRVKGKKYGRHQTMSFKRRVLETVSQWPEAKGVDPRTILRTVKSALKDSTEVRRFNPGGKIKVLCKLCQKPFDRKYIEKGLCIQCIGDMKSLGKSLRGDRTEMKGYHRNPILPSFGERGKFSKFDPIKFSIFKERDPNTGREQFSIYTKGDMGYVGTLPRTTMDVKFKPDWEKYVSKSFANPKKTFIKKRSRAEGMAFMDDMVEAGHRLSKKYPRLVKTVKKIKNPPESKYRSIPGCPTVITKDLRDGLELYKKRHGVYPPSITKTEVPNGYPKVGVSFGRVPDTVYKAPKGPVKKGQWYKHKWENPTVLVTNPKGKGLYLCNPKMNKIAYKRWLLK